MQMEEPRPPESQLFAGRVIGNSRENNENCHSSVEVFDVLAVS
jgi:hypothetical protein